LEWESWAADDLFDAVSEGKVAADAVDGNAEIFVEGTEGCKSLMLANAMYLSSWKKQMIEIPKTKEKEVAFEMEYEIELLKKQST